MLIASPFSSNNVAPKKEIVLLGVLGAFSGCIGPLVGVGGGIISIPVWREFTALPQKMLSATSLVAVGVSACTASLAFIQGGHVDFGAAGGLTCFDFFVIILHPARAPNIHRARSWAHALVLFVCSYVFSALMSISSIYFARWGAKFASGASEKILQKLLGCFMLVSVPFVFSKTAFWQQSITQSSEPAAAEDHCASSMIARVSSACISAKHEFVEGFRRLVLCCCERASILLPQAAALIPSIMGAIERLQHAGLCFSLEVQSKMLTEYPKAFAAASEFSSWAGLTDAHALQRSGAYLLLGAAGGCISGMLGVGGGVVITPCLAAFSSMPHITILGTAMVTMIPATISGTLQHHARNSVLWPQAAALAAGSVLGAAAGSNVALIVSEDTLRFVFAVMMSLFGARTLLR